MTEIDVPALAGRIVEYGEHYSVYDDEVVALARAYLAERAGREAAEGAFALTKRDLAHANDWCDRYREQLRAAEQQVAEVRRLREAEQEARRFKVALASALGGLNGYGAHKDHCERRYGQACSCGFNKVREGTLILSRAALQEPRDDA